MRNGSTAYPLDFPGETKKILEVHMFGFGLPEMIILLIIVLVIFGAGKLPQIGSAFGKSIRNFKKASEGKDEIEISPKKEKVLKES
jgi:sec-independent protein translocase protein TatA